MDDLNRRMLEAERARARARQAALEQRQAGEAAAEPHPLRRDVEGFALGDRRLRDGDAVEVFVVGAGWVAGRFRAGSPPELGVRLGDPATATAPGAEARGVGEGWLTLPEGAVCRPIG